jgi:hypothetical protein
MPARPDLAVRHGDQVFAEPAAEGLEHLLDGIERNAPHQQQLAAHAASPHNLDLAVDPL